MFNGWNMSPSHYIHTSGAKQWLAIVKNHIAYIKLFPVQAKDGFLMICKKKELRRKHFGLTFWNIGDPSSIDNTYFTHVQNDLGLKDTPQHMAWN